MQTRGAETEKNETSLEEEDTGNTYEKPMHRVSRMDVEHKARLNVKK